MGYRRDLTQEQQSEILSLVNSFELSLQGTGRLTRSPIKRKLDFERALPERWIVDAQPDGRVIVNPYLTKRCSFEYFRFLLLREFFRYLAQGITGCGMDVVRRSFGDGYAGLMAVQADLFVSRFLMTQGTPLSDVLVLYREGCALFASRDFKPHLFDRFIGSVLTLVNDAISRAESDDKYTESVFFPNTRGLAYSSEIDVLVAHGPLHTLRRMRVTSQDIADWRRWFSADEKIGANEFVPGVVSLAAGALGLRLPLELSQQIFTRQEQPAAG